MVLYFYRTINNAPIQPNTVLDEDNSRSHSSEYTPTCPTPHIQDNTSASHSHYNTSPFENINTPTFHSTADDNATNINTNKSHINTEELDFDNDTDDMQFSQTSFFSDIPSTQAVMLHITRTYHKKEGHCYFGSLLPIIYYHQ